MRRALNPINFSGVGIPQQGGFAGLKRNTEKGPVLQKKESPSMLSKPPSSRKDKQSEPRAETGLGVSLLHQGWPGRPKADCIGRYRDIGCLNQATNC